MSEVDTRGTASDRTESLRALAAENAALVVRLRSTQIPQHVGMAAACRALSIELPNMLVAELEADLRTGVLAQRWEAARTAAAELSAGGDVEVTVAALAILLRQQSRSALRHLSFRGKEWSADAYRLEGQAAALEAQAERLLRLADPAGSAADSAANDGAATVG
jgi:hypothetical protein